MTLFAVTREAGAAWQEGGIAGQPGVEDHAAFMNALEDEGFVVFGGPLGGSEHGRLHVLLIVDAGDKAEIRTRLADDPWAERLQIASVESWSILVGADRLAADRSL
jgi:uncharacterized protein YciI